MSGKDLFQVVLRLGGLYLLLNALSSLLAAVIDAPHFASVGSGLFDNPDLKAGLIKALLITFCKAVVGYYFLCYAHRVGRYAWAAEEAETRADSSAT